MRSSAASRTEARSARLALFDVDGTLVPGGSTERRFFVELVAAALIGPAQVAAFTGFWWRWRHRYGRDVLKKNKAYLAGLDVETVARLARDWAGSRRGPSWNEACLERLAGHRDAGDTVVLLTGTPQFVADALAERLGAAVALGSFCRVEAGRFTAAPPLRHPFGATKRDLAERLCRQRGFDARRAIAYADSWHDLPLLDWAGEAVAVRPDRRLRRAARARGFEILDAAAPGPVRRVQGLRS